MIVDSMKTKRNIIGLALGSGSARGWGHIGVLHALSESGIKPDIVCGTSVGALVGAAYLCNQLDMLEDLVRSLHVRDIVRYLDIKLVEGGGFVQGKRLMDFLHKHISIRLIEELPGVFGTVATDLNSGRETWFTKGSLLDAVRASIALPGIFTPVKLDDKWLVDGGLVNPVPVSLCRAMGAQVVIAVNLNGDIVGKHLRKSRGKSLKRKEASTERKLLEKLSASLKERATSIMPQPSGTPGLFDVLASSINIMQDRITRSRMAGDPPDVMLAPRLGQIGLLEFDRASEAIEEGRACVKRMLPALKDALRLKEF
ncbi:MAG TPA: patatin-like phospholipase RssA [Nitrospirae bacterium]|nr:NTE family protein RssA [bacterium BMS3Abin06]HDH12716.1 patatin-like phospholipase RssA [Nitrospirota bacterium]HDZ00025.1 patatin-like phospholipase RssA [Nitrospirota bacterium]